jgi:hypothetical protein
VGERLAQPCPVRRGSRIAEKAPVSWASDAACRRIKGALLTAGTATFHGLGPWQLGRVTAHRGWLPGCQCVEASCVVSDRRGRPCAVLFAGGILYQPPSPRPGVIPRPYRRPPGIRLYPDLSSLGSQTHSCSVLAAASLSAQLLPAHRRYLSLPVHARRVSARQAPAAPCSLDTGPSARSPNPAPAIT